MIVLALNCGSSSIKFGLFRVEGEHLEELSATTVANASTAEAFVSINEFLAKPGVPAPDAIGHRVVHGAPRCASIA